MSNNDLAQYVREELHWDPKIDDSAIAVSAVDGVVTLRGTLGSFREKRDAKQDARRVYGVKSVRDELEVRILNKDRRADADLRGDVLQALMLDSIVPSTIDAKVDALCGDPARIRVPTLIWHGDHGQPLYRP